MVETITRPNCYPYIYGKRKLEIKNPVEHIYFKVNKDSDFYLYFLLVNWPIGTDTPDLSFSIRDKSRGKTYTDIPVSITNFTTPAKLPFISGTNPINFMFFKDSPIEVIIEGQTPGTPFDPEYININLWGLHQA